MQVWPSEIEEGLNNVRMNQQINIKYMFLLFQLLKKKVLIEINRFFFFFFFFYKLLICNIVD